MGKFKDIKILILAAGFGKRLMPLTEVTPKALIEINNKSILSINIDKILDVGFSQDQIIVNTHYLADIIHEFLKYNYPQVRISYEPAILGTGGALYGAEKYLHGSDVLIHNADVISEENLESFIRVAAEKPAIASMMIRADHEAEAYGGIALDNLGNVFDIAGKLGSNTKCRYMFTGIHFIKKDVWTGYITSGFSSIIDNFYIPALQEKKSISAYISKAYWNDIGNMERLISARHRFSGK